MHFNIKIYDELYNFLYLNFIKLFIGKFKFNIYFNFYK